MIVILIFFVAHWYLSLFAQTFLQHRYAAHASFTMSKGWERFFYIFALLMQGSSYLSARTYGILHRMHHAYADTPKDPHSPKYFKSLFAMMWATKNIYSDIFDNKYPVEERFTKNLPDWPWLDKFGQSMKVRLAFIVFYISFYIQFATHWWLFLLIPFHILSSPVHGSIINWFAHKYGKVSYDVNNTSKNFLRVDVLMLGEDYHNNHHKFPTSANFGVKWFEIDPVYYVMLCFDKVGIIKIKNKGKRFVTEY